jgi:hypothetical protein
MQEVSLNRSIERQPKAAFAPFGRRPNRYNHCNVKETMAQTYLFLRPAQLPLVAAELDALSVLLLSQEDVHCCLREAIPALHWTSPTEASGEVDEGWVEFRLQPEEDGGALAMRCSLRTDYRKTVQRLCDRFGWVAFDEAATCFQPHQAPMSV